MGTRIGALQEMCAQFERNAAGARRERDALREALKQETQRASSLEFRLETAKYLLEQDRDRYHGEKGVARQLTARIHTFNTAPLWRRILTAIRGDL